MKRSVLAGAILLLIAAWLFLGVRAPTTPDRFVITDSRQYMRLAGQFLQAGSFTLEENDNADLMRAPGYPLFLALVYRLSGDYKLASLVQTLLALTNCLFIYRIPIELGCARRVGFAGVLIYLLTPNAAFSPLMILSETLTAFLLMVSLWCVVRYLALRRARWLVLSGLSMSLAAYVRPANFPLFVIWCILLLALLAYVGKTRIWKGEVVRPVLIFLISGYALILVWQARNYVTHGTFTFARVGGATLKYWIAGEGIAEIKGISREQAEYLINTSPDPNAFIAQTILQNGGTYLKFTVRGLLRTAMAAEYRHWGYVLTGTEIQQTGLASQFRFNASDFLEQVRTGNAWILLGLYATLLSLISLGAVALTTWRALMHRRASPMIFSVVVITLVSILYTTLTPLGHGGARFRVPIEPYIALLFGLAFHNFELPTSVEPGQND